MEKQKENKIYIEFFNPDLNKYEWREFYTRDIDELMEKEIIDTDSLGYAMKDMESFNKAFDILMEKKKPFSYKEHADLYIELSGQEIRITA